MRQLGGHQPRTPTRPARSRRSAGAPARIAAAAPGTGQGRRRSPRCRRQMPAAAAAARCTPGGAPCASSAIRRACRPGPRPPTGRRSARGWQGRSPPARAARSASSHPDAHSSGPQRPTASAAACRGADSTTASHRIASAAGHHRGDRPLDQDAHTQGRPEQPAPCPDASSRGGSSQARDNNAHGHAWWPPAGRHRSWRYAPRSRSGSPRRRGTPRPAAPRGAPTSRAAKAIGGEHRAPGRRAARAGDTARWGWPVPSRAARAAAANGSCSQ